ncbi:MAG TPA: TIR domain-containing protein [Silvibacterium sp.]|nr:TIR domain-containing protein [Silvibacterium sp.]
MKERHWNNLVGALRHGQCVLMLGSEIPIRTSRDGVPPSEDASISEELRLKLVRELEEDNCHPSGSSLAAIAQQYEDTEGFGSSTLRATAEVLFRSRAYGPSTVHQMLATLPFSLIITTGQDNILEQAIKAAGKSPIAQRYHLRGDKRDNPEFILPGVPATPVVYHLFGSVEEPASLVLSENDVLDFIIHVVSERPPLPNSLLRAIKRVGQSFLFLGFGIRRWDLRILVKVLVRALELNRAGPAVAAEPLSGLLQSDRDEMILFYQRGTRVELEDDTIESFLAKLGQRLEAEGGFIEQPVSIGASPHVFISYAREDEDLAARIYDALQKAYFEPWLDQQSLEPGEDWNQRIESDLDTSDFVLVLYTQAFCRKTDSYVNKEVALAAERALRVRGSFLIPIRIGEISDWERVEALRKYDEIELHPASFEDDMAKIITILRREYQRRQR